jgi:hypothetical protein
MPKGSVVYVSSADGTNMNVSLSDADTEATSSKTMGLLESALTTGSIGYVVTEGLLAGLNTSAATAGQAVWLSSTAGQFVFGSPPAKPAHSVYLGVVSRVQSNNGEIFVKVQNGYEIEELHNVSITSPTESQILAYDETAGLWKNIDIPPSAGVVTSSTPPEETSSIWFNTENGNTYIYYDDFWTSIAGSSGAPIISDTAPTDPVLGTQWFNSSTGKSYLYFSNAWIEIDSNGTSTLSTGNAIINGAFEINQRSFSSRTTEGFGFDRWSVAFSGATGTYSAQTFTLGAAPVAGHESRNFARLAITTGNDAARLIHKIESVRTFAGQTVTLSFFAKGTNPAGVGNLKANIGQYFGTGGSPSDFLLIGEQTFVLTANWVRYSLTFALPSISGKTIGTTGDDCLEIWFTQGVSTSTSAWTLDLWGVQLETGGVATPFRRNAPSIQAELAACQRYYYRQTANAVGNYLALGFGWGSNGVIASIFLPVPLRVPPTGFDAGNLRVFDGWNAASTVSSVTLSSSTQHIATLDLGSSGITQFRPYYLLANTAPSFIGINAEL